MDGDCIPYTKSVTKFNNENAFLPEPTMLTEALLLLATTLLLLVTYYKRAHVSWKTKGVPQLRPSFPFGDVASVIFRRQNMGDKIKEIYDLARSNNWKYVGLYFFSRKALLAVDPELIKNILCRDFQHFNDRGIYYDEENDPLSAHLFSLSGPKWRSLRAKLTPAFSPGKLKYMFGTVLDCGEEMVRILEEMAVEKDCVEIKEVFARYATDVIGSCAFGLECNSMRDPEAEFRKMGKRAFTQTVRDVVNVTIIRSFPKLAKILRIGIFSSTVTGFFRRVVADTITYRERNGVTRNDFLQLLIQLKNNGKLEGDRSNNETGITMDEAAAQAFIFFLAGFETTSTTISFALFEITANPEIQERARAEVERVMKKHGGQLTYEATMELHYLETVILGMNLKKTFGLGGFRRHFHATITSKSTLSKLSKFTYLMTNFLETMRKYPPAPVFLRVCTEDYKIPDTDVTIQKGLSVLIPAYGMHRDPQYFPEPNTFDPERFNEENRPKIWDYTYIPFGDGPRLCIGTNTVKQQTPPKSPVLGQRFAMIQIKIALSLMLATFEFSVNRKTIFPLKMETKGIILNPIGGLWLNFKPIKR